jgi:hypothetical protein
VKAGPLIAAATAAVTLTGTGSASPTPRSLKTCLAGHGAHFDRGREFIRYPGEQAILYWVIGHDTGGTVDMSIYFTPSPASAAALERRFRRAIQSLGFSSAEAGRVLGRQGKVVWSGAVEHPTLTRNKLPVLHRCLD